MLLFIATEMTSQMLALKMVKKLQITKEILLAKITPWMGKNFGPFF
jgi:hypothetical protein